MQWNKKFIYWPKYKYCSTNQHGDRFKRDGDKELAVARLSCEYDDTADLLKLILLSHTLDTPVRYDFDTKPQQAYIEVISLEKLRKGD